MTMYAVVQGVWEDQTFIGVFDSLERICKLFNVPIEKLKADKGGGYYYHKDDDRWDSGSFIVYTVEINQEVHKASPYASA
jgi:hypothetical protein